MPRPRGGFRPRRSSRSSPAGYAGGFLSPLTSSQRSRRKCDATDQRHLIDRAATLAGSWSEVAPARQRAALAALIKRVDIAVDRVDIQLLPTRLVPILGEALGEKLPIYDGRTDEPALVLSVPARVRRAGRGMKMLVEGRAPDGTTANPDPTLIKLIVRAYVFRDKLLQSGGKHVAADEPRPSSSYIIRVARLSYLAPDIVGAILDGHQPRGFTTEKLIDHSRLPLDWRQQRSLLGFA
jgi:site-specific DNA recombinase